MADVEMLVALCEAPRVPRGQAVRAEHGGRAYAIFNLDGKFYVTQEHCTHGPGLLSEGEVLDDEIECPFHQGRFHIPSGEPSFPPCTERLLVWTVHLLDGKICIDPSEGGTRG